MISADVPISSEVCDAWSGCFSVQLKNTVRRSEKSVWFSSQRAVCFSLRSIGDVFLLSCRVSKSLPEKFAQLGEAKVIGLGRVDRRRHDQRVGIDNNLDHCWPGLGQRLTQCCSVAPKKGWRNGQPFVIRRMDGSEVPEAFFAIIVARGGNLFIFEIATFIPVIATKKTHAELVL